MKLHIIISPAKKMNTDTDSLPWRDLPVFLDRTQSILKQLRSMSNPELQQLWKCSDQIAALNIDRLDCMNLREQLTPAILAYEGIQYQYMAPNAFSNDAFDYIQNHLFILSGFYGALKSFDGVHPYRLEMQAKLPVNAHRDLYGFWGASIAQYVADGADCIINLASKEYSVSVTKHLPVNMPVINIVFAEEKNGRLVEKATMCKMARGEMVRFMADHRIEDPDALKKFNLLDFQFSPEKSDEKNFVFIKTQKKKPL